MRLQYILACVLIVVFGALSLVVSSPAKAQEEPTPTLTATITKTLKPSRTPTPTQTFTPTMTATETPTGDTPTPTDTPTETLTPTITLTPTETLTPTATSVQTVPYPNAPLCLNHNNQTFHALWNAVDGCHYDHEHGTSPFTQVVADTFPNFDLFALLGSVQIGHTNPSSPMENTHKHGGFKWDVTLAHSAGCDSGSTAQIGVNALVAQYHAFGDYSIEFESRVHSAVGLLRQCKASNPTDYGYVFVNQHHDYGQRISPYQGAIMPYPDTPNPAYNSGLPPYFSIDCFGVDPRCRPSLAYVLSRNLNATSTWISLPQAAPISSTLFSITFRVRDNYQLRDFEDNAYPFTFSWLCSANGGLAYSPIAGCRYNNSTTRVHDVMGEIPAAWDNLAGFDTNPIAGRITAEGYATRFGTLSTTCIEPGIDCHPIKLINAFTGKYISQFGLVVGKGSFAPENLPERDVCFTVAGAYIPCDTQDALPSGWIGQEN